MMQPSHHPHHPAHQMLHHALRIRCPPHVRARHLHHRTALGSEEVEPRARWKLRDRARSSITPADRHDRIQPGNVYALTMVCQHRQRSFDDERCVQIVSRTLRAMDEEGFTASLAWVIMPDHVHWLAQLRTHTLGHCVQRFKARSGYLMNRCRQRSGAVWQPGYYDHAIRSDESLREQAMYILANPVRAKLAERIGDYPHAWCRWEL